MKKQIQAILFAASIALTLTGCSKSSLFKGAVAYWRFEGNGQDSIGHHHLATDGAENMTYVDGKVGLAMSQTGNVPSFQAPGITGMDFNQDFTLSVWLYHERSIYDNDAVFDNGSIYLAKRDASPWDSKMGLYLNPVDSRAVELVDNSSMGQPPLHTWFHVLIFRHGNTVGIKVNNEGTATVDVSNMLFQSGPTMYVGQQQHGYPWQGRLDELCLWHRALTASEMAALYNNGNGRHL